MQLRIFKDIFFSTLDITCPETSEYTTEKNYCEPTCANPTLDTDPDCLIEKEQINMGEGCECKNRYVYMTWQ
jgi:hypothetical protein